MDTVKDEDKSFADLVYGKWWEGVGTSPPIDWTTAQLLRHIGTLLGATTNVGCQRKIAKELGLSTATVNAWWWECRAIPDKHYNSLVDVAKKCKSPVIMHKRKLKPLFGTTKGKSCN